MNNWEKTTLGEIINFVNGYAFKSRDFLTEKIEGAMPIIKIRNVASGSVIFDGVNYHIYSDIYIKYTIKKGNILIAMTGNHPEAKSQVVGEVALYKDEELSLMNQRVGKILPKDGKVNNNFLYYFLKNDITHYKIAEKSAGSANQANISGSDIESLEINLPPLDEQKRIADVLSALDDKIEVNNKINENLEAQAQAIFKQWFVDFEFPDEEGKPYKSNGGKFIDSELGEIPEGWKVDSADNIFDISIGKTPPRKEPIWFSKDKIDVKWVSIADMGREGVFISNSSEYLTREAIKKFNVVVVPENTVLLSFKLTVGRISITDGEVTTNEAIAHFKTDNKTYTNYIYQYLKVYDYQSMGNTSSIANAVNSKIIKVMKIVLPSDYTLERFYDIVNPIMVKIKNKQKENRNLSEIRDSLLPRLVNGEVRV